MVDHAGQLAHGAQQMGIALSENQAEQLLAYMALLNKWNKAYNLTAVRDPDEMVSRHLLDSLSVLPQVGTGRWLDVGSGGGMPGVILAIMLPETEFTLLDSNGKKTRFVFQAITALQLGNVNVAHTRIENYQSSGQIAIVVSRAFASLADFASGCEHLCHPQTRLLAMKGVYPDAEIAELSAGWQVVHSELLEVPDTDGQRHLIELQRQDS